MARLTLSSSLERASPASSSSPESFCLGRNFAASDSPTLSVNGSPACSIWSISTASALPLAAT
jgi:hypothetical protein